jgi:myosin-crossreactive antigen
MEQVRASGSYLLTGSCERDPIEGVTMRNYDRINALPPEGINEKRAHIIGGGIAGLAAAAFLVDDAHMPGAKRHGLRCGRDHGRRDGLRR